MWGWSSIIVGSLNESIVFPMYVGVILLSNRCLAVHRWYSPCMWGWSSGGRANAINLWEYSPCMWGWSSAATALFQAVVVFPMYVGVILAPTRLTWGFRSIPHVCGGDPSGKILRQQLIEYSPCMWGVILNISTIVATEISIPHVCGGDPY